MIVKGTKQLGSFKRGINLYIPKITQSIAEQIIWKVAIFGAGAASSNGEYVWDGSTINDGKPKYIGPEGLITNNFIEYWLSDNIYVLFDATTETFNYTSIDLISWNDTGEGYDPAPSSALSYSPDSVIQSLTLTDAGTASSNGEYVWDGVTLVDGRALYVEPINGSPLVWYDIGSGFEWILEDAILGGDVTYKSNDLINWSVNEGLGDPPAPKVSAISYSA